ncbi:MAG: TonB-dependent receptor, partial [Pseudomonadota bacterium]
STDETNVAGKIGVQWDFSENAMVYGTYSTGYKGPAFNVFYNMDPDDINPIDAEESDTLEIGLKYSADWGLVNLAVYDMEIENFQANDFDDSDGTTVTGFTNGGDVETQGFEVDFLIQATEFLSFTGGFAISDAESTTGAPLPFAPDTKASFAGSYDIPLSNGSRIQIDGAYIYTDEKLSGNIGQTDADPFLLPEYTILNGSIGWYSQDDLLSITLIGKNLTDESFTTTYSGDGFRYQIPRDASRYFGVNFRLNY